MVGKRFDYEYIVIGSGAAGAAAALELARAKRKVAIVEENRWGGSALNATDVPRAAMLKVAQLYTQAVAGAKFGLTSSNTRINYPSVARWRDWVMTRCGANSTKELEEAGVTCLHGKAHFVTPAEITITGQINPISASKFLVATGATLNAHGITGLDTAKYLTPTTALKLERPPQTVLIVGGGATGVELAQYFAELGSKIVLVEMAKRLLPREDEDVSQLLTEYLTKKHNVRVFASTRVVALEPVPKKSETKVVFIKNGTERTVAMGAVILATGAKPNTDLGLNNARVSFDRTGIIVDKTFQTSARHIFAAGDVLGGTSSTDRATYSAAVAANNMLGRGKVYADFTGCARVILTDPAVAVIGLTEDDLAKRSKKYQRVFLPLSLTRAATLANAPIGFVKLLADTQGKLLGAAVMAPTAPEIIQELSLALRYDLTLAQIASTPHVAGSWTEAVALAAKNLI